MLRKLLIAAAVLVAAGAAGLLIISRPAVLNLLGRHAEPLLGYRFQVAGLELSARGASAKGIELSSPSLRGSLQSASVRAGLPWPHIEEVTIRGARLRYVWDEAAPPLDYRKALAGLPSVRHVSLRDTSVEVASKAGAWRAEAESVAADLKDFSPRDGGRLTFSAKGFRLTTADGRTRVAGALSGSAQLSALLPRPVGRASLEAELAGSLAGRSFAGLRLRLPLEASPAGVVKLSGAGLAVGQVEAAPGLTLEAASLSLPATLDLGRRRFAVSGAKAHLGGLGDVRLAASGGWQAAAPLVLGWQATVSADSLAVARLRELAAPLAPSLAGWQAAGTASLSAELSGRYAQGLTYEGEATFKLARGSFSSPDYTKAGEGIAATLRVRLKGPDRAGRRGFQAQASLPEGQLLAGEVLANLAELRPTLSADGFFLPAARR